SSGPNGEGATTDLQSACAKAGADGANDARPNRHTNVVDAADFMVSPLPRSPPMDQAGAAISCVLGAGAPASFKRRRPPCANGAGRRGLSACGDCGEIGTATAAREECRCLIP